MDEAEALKIQLAELRHRLANSFDMILALIMLRRRSAESPETLEHLAWLAETVGALGRLQQHLAAAPASEGAAFAAYLRATAEMWRQVAAKRGVHLAADIAEDANDLPEGGAAPLALIAHELLSNACEHAFPEGRRTGGRILLQLRRLSPEEGELAVHDDGVGMAGAGAGMSLGLSLVSRLAATLGGRVTFDPPGAGTVVRARFPLGAPTAAAQRPADGGSSSS
jgi:two-component sensor histidine kinase